MQQPNQVQLHQVRVYEVNGTGGWSDKGTGLLSMKPLQASSQQQPAPSGMQLALVVMGQENGTPLLTHRISYEHMYHREAPETDEYTIITWRDTDIGTDVALSFLEADGCNAVWQHIQMVQHERYHNEQPEAPRRRPSDDFDQVTGAAEEGAFQLESGEQGLMELPAPETGNLDAIAKVLCGVSPDEADQVIDMLTAPGYLSGLMELFRACEDLEDFPSLFQLHAIVRAAFMLRDPALLDDMLCEELLMDVIGCLEYDIKLLPKAYLKRAQHGAYVGEQLGWQRQPQEGAESSLQGTQHQQEGQQEEQQQQQERGQEEELPGAVQQGRQQEQQEQGQQQAEGLPNMQVWQHLRETASRRVQHRRFLSEAVVFKEVVPITDPQVVKSIRQAHHLQYIRDNIIPCSPVDELHEMLTSMAVFNNVHVLMAVQGDADFLPELFTRLKDCAPGDAAWHDLVAFLQELCGLAKHLQPGSRQALFSKLVQLGLYDIITRVMRYSEAAMKLRAVSTLLSAAEHDPLPLRAFILAQPHRELLALLVGELVGGGDAEQVVELLKVLLEMKVGSDLMQDPFLQLFYSRFLAKLIRAIGKGMSSMPAQQQGQQQRQQQQGQGEGAETPQQSGGDAGVAPDPEASATTAGLVLELLGFCMRHHACHLIGPVLRHNMVQKVLKVLQRRERWLVVAGIRFVRVCLMDAEVAQYIAKHDLINLVMDVFVDNEARDNLLASTVLELVEHIIKSACKSKQMTELAMQLMERYGGPFPVCGTLRRLEALYVQLQDGTAAAPTDHAEPADAEAAAVAGASQKRKSPDGPSVEGDSRKHGKDRA